MTIYETTIKRQGPPEGYKGRWPKNFGHALELHWQTHPPVEAGPRSSDDIRDDMRLVDAHHGAILEAEDALDIELLEAMKREAEEGELEEAPAGFTAGQWEAVLEAIAEGVLLMNDND